VVHGIPGHVEAWPDIPAEIVRRIAKDQGLRVGEVRLAAERIIEASPGFGRKRANENKARNRPTRGDQRDHTATERVSDRDDVVVDPVQGGYGHIGIIGPTRGRHIARQIRRDASMASLGQLVYHAAPTPAAVPGTVNEEKRRHDHSD
jgi:hypothetical protein